MDYSGYYKLALQKTYGGEFPEMSSEEFDRRCPLKAVPVALKALYMMLGTQRICRMHCLIPMPEELTAFDALVIVHKEGDRIWAISVDDLEEENPLIQVRTECAEEEDGTESWRFGNDGKTRLAVQMANLIAYSAGSTYEIRQSARHGKLNAIRNCLASINRKRELLLDLLCCVLIFVFIRSRISFALNNISSVLGELSILCLFLIFLFLGYSVWRLYCYWNVWIGWNDNTRFTSDDDGLFLLIRDLTLQYLRWNRPDLWFNSGPGSVELHAVALRNGPERFCQCRYEVISGESGTLVFPDTPPITYMAEKQCSVLLRTTLDETGCLRFVYINDRCNWRLPERHRLKLNISIEVLPEAECWLLGSFDLVPDKLQNLLRTKCAEIPGIKTAWLCPAIHGGQAIYLLALVAEDDVDFSWLLSDAFKISDRPLSGVIQSNVEDMKEFAPLYVRNNQGK